MNIQFLKIALASTLTTLSMSLSMVPSPSWAQFLDSSTDPDISPDRRTHLSWAAHNANPKADSPNAGSQSSIPFTPPPPPDQGTPVGRLRGGASRSQCSSYESLMALVPTTTDDRVWGLTTASHPSLWFYLPDEVPPNGSVEFVLQDQDDNYIYHTQLPASSVQRGLAQFVVPETASPLEFDELYHWTLAVYCDPDKPSQAVFVSGTMQRVRVNPELQRQLDRATGLEKVELYAANGIWYETFNLLTSLYQESPHESSLRETWFDTLAQYTLLNLRGMDESEPTLMVY